MPCLVSDAMSIGLDGRFGLQVQGLRAGGCHASQVPGKTGKAGHVVAAVGEPDQVEAWRRRQSPWWHACGDHWLVGRRNAVPVTPSSIVKNEVNPWGPQKPLDPYRRGGVQYDYRNIEYQVRRLQQIATRQTVDCAAYASSLGWTRDLRPFV